MGATNITSYKCPCCGAELKFSSSSQKMTCEYCGTEMDVAAVEQFNQTAAEVREDSCGWNDYSETEMSADENSCAYVCKSCGAEIVGDKTLGASECPYCGSPVVMNDKFDGMLRPDYIIPFRVDKEKAKEEFRNFCKGKKLLPGDFISSHRIESIQGIYVPYWLFDCDTEASIRFRATKVKTWTEGNYEVTKTDNYLVIRDGQIGFDHVPVDGSTKMDHAYTEAVEPFITSEAVPFGTAYLSGYLADRYDRSAEESKPRANERIKNSVESEFENTVEGYTTVTTESSTVNFKDGKISYSLMPMWIMTAKYGDKQYTFAMNGQTGRFVGKLPFSMGKAVGWFIGIAAVSSVVLTLILSALGM